MKHLSSTDKQRMLTAIENLPPDHYKKVKDDIVAEEEHFKRRIASLTPSRKKMQEEFTI